MTERPPPAGFQYEIYLSGAAGITPEHPISVTELEAAAYDAMSDEARGYVEGGAGAETTVTANRDAFYRWRIVPRMLRDVSERDLSVELFGTAMPAPVMLAPVGVLSIVHPDAEPAVARAARATEVPFAVSTLSSFTMEEVADAAGDAPRFFQLYRPGDPDLTASFVKRAEAAGYAGIFVTLDSTFLGWRPRDLGRGYLPFLRAEGLANYLADPVFRAALDSAPEDDVESAVLRWVQVFSDPAFAWDDLATLREMTDLPLIVKGVLHPDDARIAVDAGMDGIVVSNHGGRQVDGSIATLDALGGIVDAAGDDAVVLLDGGIRTGADAVKALALGARAVLLGRPYVWGLALGGEAGVTQVVRSFLAELDLTLALTGHTSIAALDDQVLTRAE